MSVSASNWYDSDSSSDSEMYIGVFHKKLAKLQENWNSQPESPDLLRSPGDDKENFDNKVEGRVGAAGQPSVGSVGESGSSSSTPPPDVINVCASEERREGHQILPPGGTRRSARIAGAEPATTTPPPATRATRARACRSAAASTGTTAARNPRRRGRKRLAVARSRPHPPSSDSLGQDRNEEVVLLSSDEEQDEDIAISGGEGSVEIVEDVPSTSKAMTSPEVVEDVRTPEEKQRSVTVCVTWNTRIMPRMIVNKRATFHDVFLRMSAATGLSTSELLLLDKDCNPVPMFETPHNLGLSGFVFFRCLRKAPDAQGSTATASTSTSGAAQVPRGSRVVSCRDDGDYADEFGDSLEVTVRCDYGPSARKGLSATVMRIRTTDVMRTLMERYAHLQQWPVDALAFHFDGAKVRGQETAAELGLEDGDCLDCSVVHPHLLSH